MFVCVGVARYPSGNVS